MRSIEEILSGLQKRAIPWYIHVFELLGLLLALAVVGFALLETLKQVVWVIVMLLFVLLLCSCFALAATSEAINYTTRMDREQAEIETLALSWPVNLKPLQLNGNTVYSFDNEVRMAGLEAIWNVQRPIFEPLPREFFGRLAAPASAFIPRSKHNDNHLTPYPQPMAL